jgi:hypothetical protein
LSSEGREELEYPTCRLIEMLSTFSVFMAWLLSCSGREVETSVKHDSSGKFEDEGLREKWRRTRPPGAHGSHDAEHGNAGKMAGILKKRLQQHASLEGISAGECWPNAPAHMRGFC